MVSIVIAQRGFKVENAKLGNSVEKSKFSRHYPHQENRRSSLAPAILMMRDILDYISTILPK